MLGSNLKQFFFKMLTLNEYIISFQHLLEILNVRTTPTKNEGMDDVSTHVCFKGRFDLMIARILHLESKGLFS